MVSRPAARGRVVGVCPCFCCGAIPRGISGCDGAWRSVPRVLGRTTSESRLEEIARDLGRVAVVPIPPGGPCSLFLLVASSSPSESTIKTYSALKRSLCCIPCGSFALNPLSCEIFPLTSEGYVNVPWSLSCWLPAFKVKYSLELDLFTVSGFLSLGSSGILTRNLEVSAN